MPDSIGQVWLSQAASDLEAAETLWNGGKIKPTLYCQAIAKYQQSVEKSVKAVALDMRSAKMQLRGIGPDDYQRHPASAFVTAFVRGPSARKYPLLPGQLCKFFDQKRRGLIKALDSLVPKKSDSRNTEYPYRLPGGTLQAPAHPTSFSLKQDVEPFRQLAHEVVDFAKKIIGVIARGPK